MTLKTAPGTQALLDLEDAAPGVLFERLPGSDAPFWPQVRSDFMVALQFLDFGSVPIENYRSRADVVRQVASAFIPSRRDARRLGGHRPIVHIVGGTTTHRVGSTTRNWLVGDYLESYPEKSAVLQWADLPDLRAAFEPTRSLSSMRIRSAVSGRLSPGRSAITTHVGKLVREFARLLEAPISEDQLRAITDAAAFVESTRRHAEKPILALLDRLRPEVILMEDAAYGTWSALIAASKRRGVRVVEPQHGWIGPTHAAYNFGAAMSTPELSATLPDELLTFGKYWSSSVRVPFSTTDIGKPHLETMARGVVPWDKRPDEVLLVSSIADPEGANDFALELAQQLPDGWRLRFRPHPSERPVAASRYGRMLTHSRVILDDEPDVYMSLGTARGVVGVASTVLFEALALGCRVFARESVYAPYYVGDLFGPLVQGPESVGVVIEGLAQPSPTVPRATLDAIWQPDATRNFREWMDATLAG